MRFNIILLFLTFCWLSLLAQKPDILVQSGHTNRINAITVSSDNKLFATGSIDNTIRVWDVDNGKLLAWYKNSDGVNSLEFYPGNHYLVSADFGLNASPLKVWDIAEGTYGDMQFYGGAMDLELSSTGKFLAASSSRGKVALWNMQTDEGLWYYDSKTEATMKSLAFSQDESLISSGTSALSGSSFLYTWATDTNKLISAFAFETSIERLTYISADEILVEQQTWTNTNKVFKANVRTGEVVFLFDMSSMVVFKDNEHIAGLTADNTVSIYELYTGEKVRDIAIHEKFIDAMTLSPDERKLFVAGRDIEAVDLTTGKSLYYIEGDTWIDAMTFASSGNRLAFSGDDDEIVYWDVKEGDVDIWEGHEGHVTDLFFDKEGNYLASASTDTTVIIWNPDGSIKHRFLFNDNDFHTVSMNPSADWLAVSEGDTIYSVAIEEGYLGAKWSLGDVAIEKVIYSPNNRDIGYLVGGYLLVWDVFEEVFRLQLPAGTEDMAFSGDGRYVAAGGYEDSLIIWDLDSNRMMFADVRNGEYVNSLSIDPNSMILAAGYDNGIIRVFDFEKGVKIAEFNEHGNLVNKLSFRDDGAILASSSWDGQLVLWDMKTFAKLAELYAFDDGSWAVIDDDGRYDASDGGNIPHLHFVAEGEVISLDQLKERFYEPGLLQKLLGYKSEPLRDVSKLSDIALYPLIDLDVTEENLIVHLMQRDGGIGRVQFFINGKEVDADITNSLLMSPDSLFGEITVDLTAYGRFLRSGDTEILTVVAYNEEGYLSSPKINIPYEYDIQEEKEEDGEGNAFTTMLKPRLYGIVVGTADYRGDKLDLQFADKDARDFSSALEQVGNVMFGEAFVDVVTYDTGTEGFLPTKDNIEKAFRDVAEKATGKDVLVVYMSGHGVNHANGYVNQFHYLTMDVESGNIDDAEVRKNYTISTEELTEWIKSIPVKKQVLILDACASGQAIEDILVAQKSVTSGQVRALERLKDRTGMFILTGSASDKVSFEASRFGQSLLTYSLLSGMKGQALRDGAFVDVLTLFEHAVDKVPDLAAYIGGVQKPILAVPYGGLSFDIGQVDETVSIQLETVKPVFIRSNFQDEIEFADVLGLSDKIDELFRDQAVRAKSNGVLFVDVNKYPEAYSIKGRYIQDGGSVKVTARVFKDKTLVGTFEVEGQFNEMDVLVNAIIDSSKELVKKR